MPVPGAWASGVVAVEPALDEHEQEVRAHGVGGAELPHVRLFDMGTLPRAAGPPPALAPLLRAAMDMHAVSAEIYTGGWTDVGTPERLRWLNQTSP